MNISKLLLGLAAGSLIFATSCNKDKEDPTGTITSPAEHSHFDRGSSFEVDVTFEDDKELKSYVMEMANEDGSHNHNFHWGATGDLSGESQNVTVTVQVPDSAPMMQWLHVTVTDAEEKSTELDPYMLHFD